MSISMHINTTELLEIAFLCGLFHTNNSTLEKRISRSAPDYRGVTH